MSTTDTCNQLITAALGLFQGANGLNQQLSNMASAYSLVPVGTFLKLSGAVDAYEKSESVRYPVASVYCDRLKNVQQEKFRTLSGTASLVLELRVSGAKADELETVLNSYVEAACMALTTSQGAWGTVGTYAGTYEVKFQAIRAGGKQFVKSARIEFDIHVSK